MQTQREVERVFALEPDADVPDLAQMAGVARVGEPRIHELSAMYVDTAGLALTRAGVSLRRRTGGADDGWHLKVPVGEDRDEIRAPLGRSGTTARLAMRRAVLAWTRGDPLEEVALLETHRTIIDLYDSNGVVLAEVADDRVVGIPIDSPPVRWRELEVELADGDPGLLDDIAEWLTGHGIRPSDSPRKIAVVLAGRLGGPVLTTEPGTAGAVLHQRLTEQVTELLRRDSEVRRRVPDGVHQVRVTCRRLRAALATFRPLLDREVTEPIREELRWVAHTLGAVRDAEVMHQRLRDLLDEETRATVVGPVRRRLRSTYVEQERIGLQAADELLGSARYFALLASLDALVADPPWTGAAGDDAKEMLRRRLRKERKRVRRRVEASRTLTHDGEAEAYDTALHDVRKTAKRFRYAAEAAEPVLGKRAREQLKTAKQLTQVLGERQDTSVTRADLMRIGRAADEAGENTFTYGRLHAREQGRGLELEREFARHWQKLS
ncbi:MAG: CYTH and CHAD domain-containing protein [Nocardioides sp.]